MNKSKKILIASITINILVFILIVVYIYDKGGINYITQKIKNTNYNEYTLVNIQRESLFENLNINKDCIIFIGDSITQRCEWSELFNNPNIKNRGIDSNRTDDIVKRIDIIINGQPKKVFIMIGINDILNNVSPIETINNYTDIIKKIKSGSPSTQVYIQSVLPTNMHNNNSKVIELNKKLSSLANTENVEYINLFSSFANDNNDLKDGLSKDGIHLMSEGYDIWKKIIEKYVSE